MNWHSPSEEPAEIEEEKPAKKRKCKKRAHVEAVIPETDDSDGLPSNYQDHTDADLSMEDTLGNNGRIVCLNNNSELTFTFRGTRRYSRDK